MCLSHDTLVNHYQVNFTLMQHHKYSLTEIEMMIPWEREVYLTLLKDFIREQREQEQARNM